MLQVFLDGHGAGAQDVANVAVDLALDHPVQHLGLARCELEAQGDGLDHGFIRHLLHDDEPVAAALGVTDLLVQAKGQALRPLLNAQARRLDQHGGVAHMTAQPLADRLGCLRRLGAVVAQQQFARQRGLPHQFAVAHAHGDAGIAKSVQRGSSLAFFTCALQVHLHAGQHFLGLDRLGDVVHTARLQRGHQVFGIKQAGHEDDGDVRRLRRRFQAPGHLKTVHAGHHGVQQHNVGQGLRRALQGRLAVGGDEHGVAGFVQRVVQHRQVVGHVVHDQHEVAVGTVQRLLQRGFGGASCHGSPGSIAGSWSQTGTAGPGRASPPQRARIVRRRLPSRRACS